MKDSIYCKGSRVRINGSLADFARVYLGEATMNLILGQTAVLTGTFMSVGREKLAQCTVITGACSGMSYYFSLHMLHNACIFGEE